MISIGVCNYSNAAYTSLPEKNVLEQSISLINSTNAELLNADDINDSKFEVYINDGILTIKYNKPAELANGEVIVFNLLGQEVARKRLEVSPINQIPLSVQNTCYIVKISYSGKVHTKKVVPSSL